MSLHARTTRVCHWQFAAGARARSRVAWACTHARACVASEASSAGGQAARGTRTRRRAFTLIEVMATLLLVGIVLPAIMEGISLSNGAGRYAKTSREATALAQQKLDEIVATTVINAQPTTGVYSGDFASVKPEYEAYKWTAEMNERTDIENELQVSGILEATVRVSWPIRGEERTVALSTLVYVSQSATGTGQSSGQSGGTGGAGGTGTGSSGRSTGTTR